MTAAATDRIWKTSAGPSLPAKGPARKRAVLGLLLLLGSLAGGIAGASPPAPSSAAVAMNAPSAGAGGTTSPAAGDPILLAAGDIARCGEPGASATAALLERLPGTVATLGDNAYRAGSKREFAACYDPTWGAAKGRTRPSPGNHEYGTRGAQGYFGYFGAAAGDRDTGYYSYDLGEWHVVALNSNCAEAGGCGAGSPQERWLRADLAAHPAACTLAYWHHPLFSSGAKHGGEPTVRPLWQALAEAGADVVLAGHEHNYERFAPQDASGRPDPRHGIRQFVVGTGGAGHYGFGTPLATSERRNADTFGVLRLTLRPDGYDWRFLPAAGGSFTDTGRAACQ